MAYDGPEAAGADHNPDLLERAQHAAEEATDEEGEPYDAAVDES